MNHKVTNTLSSDSTSQISSMELEAQTATDSSIADENASSTDIKKKSTMESSKNTKKSKLASKRIITTPKSSILKSNTNSSISHCINKSVSISHTKPTRSIEISKKKVVEKLIPQNIENNTSGIMKVKLTSEETLWKKNYADAGSNTISTVSICKRNDSMLQRKNARVNSKTTQTFLKLQITSVFSRGIQVFLRGPPTLISAKPSINKSCYTHVRTSECGSQYVNYAIIEENKEKCKHSTLSNITHRPVYYDSLSSPTNHIMIEHQKKLIQGARRWNIPNSYEHMYFA